ncbi:MAG: hypothetical protein LBP19_01720 [Treponema sp.]|jgi:hypothetical protein|nr:hypothetical protein [Treponema sp.]
METDHSKEIDEPLEKNFKRFDDMFGVRRFGSIDDYMVIPILSKRFREMGLIFTKSAAPK